MLEIVELAKSYIGINEKAGTHKQIIDIYNSHKPLARGYRMTYTDAWCATFISALAIKCNLTDIIPTECGCERQIDLFKKLGEWVEADNYVPKEGDIIYYDWQDSGKGDNQGWSDHVGIVEKCDGMTITVIEGNYKDSVARRCIAVNAKYIRGFAVPKYPKPDTSNIEKFVQRLYKEILGRQADKYGLEYWVSLLDSKKITITELLNGFFNSEEFLSKNYSDEDYVVKLYSVVLNRKPDNSGKKYWLNMLKSKSRSKVLAGFTNSIEFKELCKSYGVDVLL